jgi:hypothetical protein
MQRNKILILQEILNKKLKDKLIYLDRSYLNHSKNLDFCFNNIDYMKSKIYF